MKMKGFGRRLLTGEHADRCMDFFSNAIGIGGSIGALIGAAFAIPAIMKSSKEETSDEALPADDEDEIIELIPIEDEDLKETK